MVSVMFYNYHGLVYKNAVCGNIPHVLEDMPHRKRFKLQPQKGLLPEEVYQWIEESSFEICGKSGIRCFSDYIGNMKTWANTSMRIWWHWAQILPSGALPLIRPIHPRMG